MKTTKISTGVYKLTIDSTTYKIVKFGQSYWELFEGDDNTSFIAVRRTKKDCVNFALKRHGKSAENKSGVFEARVGNREVINAMGKKTNHCFPIAVARALSGNPDDVQDVAAWAKEVSADLLESGAMTEDGTTWNSHIRMAMRTYGLADDYRPFKIKDTWARNNNKRYQTVTQWLKDNPEVTEAIFLTTGHASYYKDGKAYGLGPRMRVTGDVYVLATK